MKKLLLGTTAIITLAAGSAMAADAPTLSLGGFAIFEGIFNSGKDAGALGQGVNFTIDEFEVHFKVKGVADNGLEYGATLEHQGEAGDTDEAYIWMGGGWGTTKLGYEDGAEDLLGDFGSHNLLGAAGGWDGENSGRTWLKPSANSANYLTNPDLGNGDTSDASKVSYFTPSFSGFKAGISYTPDSGLSSSTDTDAVPDDTGTSVQDHIGIGAEYTMDVSDVKLGFGGNVAFGNNEQEQSREDTMAWSLSAKAGFMGFTVAGQYVNLGDSGLTKTDASAGANAGKSWNVGMNYVTGPVQLGAGYFGSKTKGSTGIEYETDWFAATVNYTVAPGLLTYVEYDYIDMSDNVKTTTNDNTVNMFIVGTKVSF